MLNCHLRRRTNKQENRLKKKRVFIIILDRHWQLTIARILFANDFHVFQYQLFHKRYFDEV